MTRPVDQLVGLDLAGGWHVKHVLKPRPENTGGCFSVGYLVVGSNGQQAFLKALDFSGALQNPDPTRALQAMTESYNFERDILNKCASRSLKRIATPLADGVANAPGGFGALGAVPYLIFELASGDIRNAVTAQSAFDLAWCLRTLHHVSVGLRQLHSVDVAHQDLKPSNVLVFPDAGARVSDLGRASARGIPSPADQFRIPGDPGYAAPEQIYGWQITSDFSHRYYADLYHLGSMLHFLFTGTATTQALGLKLSAASNKAFVRNGFLADLPYLENAFTEIMEDLTATVSPIAGDLGEEITALAKQLCHPDPRRRGDPRTKASIRPSHDLQAFVSKFDRLAGKAEWRLK